MKLNVVYIGPLSFPLGFASTKRRRYMVDYMNNHDISSYVLCTRYKKNEIFQNSSHGFYKKTEYYDLSDDINKGKLFHFWSNAFRCIKKWYNKDKKNILIFHTNLLFVEFPIFIRAKQIGYKIVFDQVETSYSALPNRSIKNKIFVFLNELVSRFAYKQCDGSFVISKALEDWIRTKYPSMSMVLLPNATPILYKQDKKENEILTLLYSGTYAPKDGVVYLIDGVKKAIAEGVSCKLILLGKGSDADMECLKTVSDNSAFEYWGLVDDDKLVDLLQSSDVLFMTRINSTFSNYGFPFKLSEYLSTGNLVVSTIVSDVSLYLTDMKDAILIPPEDSDSIANTILWISNNMEKAKSIGLAGLETMKAAFSIERVGEKFQMFLEKL